MLGKCPTKWRQCPDMTIAVDWDVKLPQNFDAIRAKPEPKDTKLDHTVHTARQIPTGTSNSRCLCQRVRYGG